MCRRILRHIEVDNALPIMRQHEEHEKDFECRRWLDKEVDSYEAFHMLIEKRPPCRRWRPTCARFVFLIGWLRDLESELLSLQPVRGELMTAGSDFQLQ